MQITDQELQGTACIITGGLLDTHHAKTAHGLIRESKRFTITTVIDEKLAGRDAGEFVDNRFRNIPIYSSVEEMIKQQKEQPQYAVIGMATKGGVLPDSLYPVIKEVLQNGIHIVNGLHQPLSDIKELSALASENNTLIYDIRRPKGFEDLHFWSGKILEVNCLKIGILGTDCAIGKRTTAKLLTNALNEAGVSAQMIYTGQTGWLQGGRYGFVFDATPNDFIPGEIEHSIYECWKNENPEVIIVEGQASLRNPGGPCGSEFIISGRLDGVILQHHPVRIKYSNLESFPDNIPDVMEDVELIKMLGSDTWALTLNTGEMSPKEIGESKQDLSMRSGLPVVCPFEEGMKELVEMVKSKLVRERIRA